MLSMSYLAVYTKVQLSCIYYIDKAYYFHICPIIYARQVVVFSLLDEEIK